MSAQLPDQTKYTGFIPKDLYNDFLKNKALYDQRGAAYPTHYYQYYGIPYKVWYGDPFTLIDYVDSATARYDPAIGLPGVTAPIVVANLEPPSPDMVIPGFGIPDPRKIEPIIPGIPGSTIDNTKGLTTITPQPYTPTPISINTGGPDLGSGQDTGGFGISPAALAWAALGTAIAYGYTHVRRRSKARAARGRK